MASTHFTEPTTNYWQKIESKDSVMPSAPWKFKYPATLPDNTFLYLPIRPLQHSHTTTPPTEAVASLFLTQASFNVVDTLSTFLLNKIRERFGEDVEAVIGLPTLGLAVAGIVAKGLGFDRYVALGSSRKFWYTDELSSPLSSITSPDAINNKRIYLDPHQLPLIKNKKIVIIDDAVSSGTTLKYIYALLSTPQINCTILGCGVVMKQGFRWKEALGEERSKDIIGVFECPLLKAVEEGWVERA